MRRPAIAPAAVATLAALAGACGRDDAPAPGRAPAAAARDADLPDDARCRAFMQIPMRDLGPLEVIERCGPLFPPRCRTALATARVDQSIDDGLAIIRACAAEACPLPDQLLCGPRPSLADAVHGFPALARAIMANPSRRIVSGKDDLWRAAVGEAIAGELLPLRAVVVRCEATPTAIRVAIDGGGSWTLGPHAAAEDFAPLAAAVANAGADAAGVLIWGAHDLGEDARHAISIALGRAGVLEVVHCAPGGGNCR